MAKTGGVSYDQVAQACQSLLDEKQKITVRSILSITGGSPNTVLEFYRQWRQQQDDISMADIEEDLSLQIRQAILAECARKTTSIKEVFTRKVTDAEQQLTEVKKLLANFEQQLEDANSKITEQGKEVAVNHQRFIDSDQRLKEMEALYRTAIMAQERTQTEKEVAEKQAVDLQNRLLELTQEFKALQASKHQADLEIATLKAQQVRS